MQHRKKKQLLQSFLQKNFFSKKILAWQCNMKILEHKKCSMKVVQHGKTATWKECNMKDVQYEKSATWKERNTKKVQYGNSNTWKECNTEYVQYGNRKTWNERNTERCKMKRMQHRESWHQKKCNTKKVKHECNMKRVKKFKLKENMKCEKNGDTLTLFRMGSGKYYPTWGFFLSYSKLARAFSLFTDYNLILHISRVFLCVSMPRRKFSIVLNFFGDVSIY